LEATLWRAHTGTLAASLTGSSAYSPIRFYAMESQ